MMISINLKQLVMKAINYSSMLSLQELEFSNISLLQRLIQIFHYSYSDYQI